MLEFAHTHLVIIAFIAGVLVGGAGALAALVSYIVKEDMQNWLPEPPKHRHTMDVTADRDKIAEAVGAFN